MSGNHAGWLDWVPSAGRVTSVVTGRPAASRTRKSTIEIWNDVSFGRLRKTIRVPSGDQSLCAS
jgi:hypothetical protein